MKRPRPALETEPAFVREEADGAEERSRTDRDRAAHLLPRRWRPSKRPPPTLGAVDGLGDVTCERANKFRVF